MTGRWFGALAGALGLAALLSGAPTAAFAQASGKAPRYPYRFELPASAFSLRPSCPLDPFNAADAPSLEQRLQGQCRASAWLGGRTALDGGGSIARWRVDHQWLVEPQSQWMARLRVRLGAAVNGSAGAAPVAPLAELAAGLWWQPDSDWAMNLRFGQRVDAGERRQRTELTGAWRLGAQRLLFARWAEEGDQARPELGLRWWLLRRMAFLDLAWPATRNEPDGARLRLQWRGFQL